jgi:uncharacterized membrane protein YdjX (TVP38/TMEM64 family)
VSKGSSPAETTLPGQTAARAILRLGLLVAGLLAGGLALRAFSGGLETGFLQRSVVGQGFFGVAVFLALASAACAVGVPRQAAGFAAGYAFGFWAGILLALLAQVLGCIIDFVWARLVARDWARRRPEGRLARLDAFFASHPFTTTLIARLLPVGNNLAFCLLAGVSSVRAGPFLAGSALGYVPQTVVFALLGGGARLGAWVQIALGVLLLAASIGLGIFLLRRHRQEADAVGALSEES